jgi:hypothetical protein
MIAHDGEAKTEQWLKGVKANLARKATGGDRDGRATFWAASAMWAWPTPITWAI